jgi:hypothetical protein
MKLVVVGLLVASVAGCASVTVTGPATYSYDRSRTYQMSYEKTWVRAVDWFADHNVTIEKVEKTSGLITAKYRLKTDDEYLDCGKIEVSGTLGPARIESYASLNVTVRTASDNETKVNANVFGTFDLDGKDAWDGRSVKSSGRCVSNGKLEKSILDFIAK